MNKKKSLSTICRQCRKDIKTEIYVCLQCDKGFHPSCHKQHRIYVYNELVPCKGKIEIFTIKGGFIEEGNSVKRGGSVDSGVFGEGGASAMRSDGEERVDLMIHARDGLDIKIDNIYKLLKELRMK